MATAALLLLVWGVPLLVGGAVGYARRSWLWAAGAVVAGWLGFVAVELARNGLEKGAFEDILAAVVGAVMLGAIAFGGVRAGEAVASRRSRRTPTSG